MEKTLGIRVDPLRSEPMYRQIADQIVVRIRTGALPAGFRLPATRELASELAAHRNTVIRAYDELVAAGFVVSTVGRGTFVTGGPSEPPRQIDTPNLPWESLIAGPATLEPLRRMTLYGSPHADGGAVNLARMQPPAELIPAEQFRKCMDAVLKSKGARALGYAPREGIERLRELIAEDLGRQGVPASPDDLIVTSGSQQAIDVVARMLLGPGDLILLNHSTYGGAIDIFAASGARLVGVPSDDEGPDVAALDRLASSGAKGFYLMPNCQNPTGEVVSRRRREALVAWSHRAGVPIIEDDYGADLILDGEPLPPALRTLDGNVLYIGTYSKKLIPALRVGFVLCPPAVRSHVTSLKHAMDLGTSALLQHALAEFLERGYLASHLKHIREAYRARRDALEAGLAASLPRQMRWRSPRTGMVLWLPLPAPLDSLSVAEEARRRGVLVSPGLQFATGVSYEEGLRLTFCSEPPERLEEGARRLGAAIAAAEAERRPSRARGRETAPIP